MDRRELFERNLLALSGRNPALCSRLSSAETTLNRYRFLESRTGELIPAWVDAGGAAHPLHSLVDPRREGERLAAAGKGEGFLVFLGLGGGYGAAAALRREDTRRLLVIDYDMDAMAELLCSREYIELFKDHRFQLLVDPPEAAVERYILDNYQPALCGGIRTLPLRTRTVFSQPQFGGASAAIESAIAGISADYSVQAYFGTRWFSNIIRNIPRAEQNEGPLPPVREAAITAAGPSLDGQLGELAGRRKKVFLLATDTSLPALAAAGLEPDGVVSIDCQHISYYHFMETLPPGVRLFLDLASPPPVVSRSPRPRFFSGGHPLTRYVSRYWRAFPQIDTAGANVTYAALSLAERLGAEKIRIYGADFSYPGGQTYAGGTYIHGLFARRQTRLDPLEALYSAFLFRGPLEKRETASGWYYETETLRRYRQGLEGKIRSMAAEGKAVLPVPGRGAPVAFPPGPFSGPSAFPGALRSLRLFSMGPARMSGREFLKSYREKIRALPLPDRGETGAEEPGGEEGLILATLLPAAAALKRRRGDLSARELMGAVREFCIDEIDRVLAGSS